MPVCAQDLDEDGARGTVAVDFGEGRQREGEEGRETGGERFRVSFAVVILAAFDHCQRLRNPQLCAMRDIRGNGAPNAAAGQDGASVVAESASAAAEIGCSGRCADDGDVHIFEKGVDIHEDALVIPSERRVDEPSAGFSSLPDQVVSNIVNILGDDDVHGARALAALAGTSRGCRRVADDARGWWVKIASPLCTRTMTSCEDDGCDELRGSTGGGELEGEESYGTTIPEPPGRRSQLPMDDLRRRIVVAPADASSSSSSSASSGTGVSAMQGQKHVTRTVSAWRRAQAWSVAWGEGRARALATR